MKPSDRKAGSARRLLLVVPTLLLGGLASLAQAPPGKALIADVIPQGNRLVPTAQVMSMIKTKPGTEYNQETVKEDLRRLYESKRFAKESTVRWAPTADGKVNVYFQLVEMPSTVQEIIYQGAKHIKQDELDSLTGIRKGEPLNPIKNRLGREAILRRLKEDGRLFSSVDLVEGDQVGDTRVVFNITEGKKVKVTGIDFIGNEFVGDARIKTQVNTSARFLGIFGGNYNEIMTDLDVNKLETYYKTFGYHDVRVSRELQWEDHEQVRVVFHIHEGQRYRVDSVQVNGNKVLAKERLLAATGTKPGEFYSDTVVQADVARMQAMYGYTGRQVKVNDQIYASGDGLVAVHYDIEERPPNQVGQIFIVGNEVTRQNVILRQVPLYPGQILTYPDLRVAEANLARLNIFEMNQETGVRPTVTVLDPEGPNPVKDLLVTVQEAPTGSLLFGFGVNSDAGLTGSIVLNERNFDILNPPTSLEELLSGKAFRGGGQEFRAEAVPGTQLQRYTVSFREPFLFDSLFSLGTSGYYFTRRYDEYDEGRLGGRLTLGRRLSPLWTASAGLRIEDVDVFNIPLFAPNSITDAAGENFLLGLRLGLARDTRDSFLRPTCGSLLEFGVEQCFGDFTFPIFTAEYNKFWTLYQRPDGSGRHVLAARSQVGIAGDDTPVYERFYAGGFRSLRGFEFRGVGPNTRGFMVGGDFLLLNSLEYQLPVVANDQLFLVGFIDSGTVERDIEIKNYRVTVGAGARIVVPMMGPLPIALDFGVPLVKADTDREQIFSFWVGFFH